MRSSSVRWMMLMTMVITAAWLSACGDDDDGGTGPDPETGSVRAMVVSGGAEEAGVAVGLYASGGSSALETGTTGSDGSTTFSGVEPGSYDVEVEVPAGRELVAGEVSRKTATVTADQTAEVEFDLEPEEQGDVVEVVLTGDLTFEPSTVTIEPGTTVRWRVQEAMAHTVTPDGHDEWTSAALSAAGETFEHTFTDEGEFDYFCQPHVSVNMRGLVRVQQ